MAKEPWGGIPVISFLVVVAAAGGLLLPGCMEPPIEPVDAYLVKVGHSTLTVAEFNEVFEISKTGYSHSDTMDPQVMADIKLRLLNQLIEEMILIERAGEVGISVSDRELESEIRKIKADYPDGVFEEMLLEAAVSFEVWKKRLRTQLIARKFIQSELAANITITSEEVARYYAQYVSGDTPGEMDAGETDVGGADSPADGRPVEVDDAIILKMLRNQKIQAAYAEWIKVNRRSVNIDINSQQWEAVSQAAS